MDQTNSTAQHGKDAELLRVELRLVTTMWNEGFEKAEEPWLTLYTDNGDWARSIPESYSVVPTYEPLPQDFIVRVDELATRLPAPTQSELDAQDWEAMEDGVTSARFVALTPGLSSAELDGIVANRLSQWDGV